jgi:hypothetical protein
MEVATRSAGLKVLALCTALGLGGGYVWQRQKAAEPTKPEAASEAEIVDGAEKRSMMPGSKSAVFHPQPDLAPPGWFEKGEVEVDPGREERTVLPGSKVGEIVVFPPEAEEPPRKRTVLPGSKSIDRILQPPAPEEQP